MSVVDTSSVPQNARFPLLKDGNYYADIEKVAYKNSRAGHKMLTVDVSLGKRKVFVNFNVGHPKEDVKSRAIQDVADMLFACGIDKLESWEEAEEKLLAKKILVRIYSKKNKDKTENAIGTWAKYTGECRNGSKIVLGIDAPKTGEGTKASGEKDDDGF